MSPLDATSDRERLISALADVAGGDRAALQWVYDRTSAKLFGVCLRILQDRSEAEDVLQEVYLTVWARAGAFDVSRGVSPITWLATLARNRAIDRLRASKSHLSRPIETALNAADSSPSAVDRLESADELQRLTLCLGELEPAHAAYIRAAFFDGHSYATLASTSGVALGTMKSWIRRALMRLKTCMEAGHA
jgi:RNA polymerase sigma factor (sigma-70 family)